MHPGQVAYQNPAADNVNNLLIYNFYFENYPYLFLYSFMRCFEDEHLCYYKNKGCQPCACCSPLADCLKYWDFH